MAFALAGFTMGLALGSTPVLDERGESFWEQGSRAADVGEELLEAARAIPLASRITSSVHFLPDDVEGAFDRAVPHPQFRQSFAGSCLHDVKRTAEWI